MACCLKEIEIKRLCDAKSNEKDGEVAKMGLNPSLQKLLKGRHGELEKVYQASRGVCLIEIGLELELDRRDMEDALDIDDVHQLVEIFPALTKANSQRLLDTLKARKYEFEETLNNEEQIVVEMNYTGMGIHCGEGWIATDQRLLENLTQISNAMVTFVVGTGNERKEIKFEPTERLSFHVSLKERATKTCSATHPGLAFMKLGRQASSEDNPDYKATEFETHEQQLLDDADLPVFRLPLFNDLEITKKILPRPSRMWG